jgi:serine/threonine-protein kinase
MRFIRGESLSRAIHNYHAQTSPETSNSNSDQKTDSSRQIRFRKLLQNFVSVCNTLHYAHDRGVIHRDIKPENIMIGSFGETLVVDWGIAKTGVENSQPSSQDPALLSETDKNLIPELTSNETTRQGDIMGTPSYMSPEQILGWQDRINPSSDVYSLGATLYTLLTGKPPYYTANFDELFLQVLEGKVEPPRKVKPSIPPALEAITLKAMSTTQSQRFNSSLELANDIEAWLADEPTTAYRDPLWQRVKRWLKRHPAIAAATAASVALTIVSLIVGLAIVGGFNRKLEKSNEQLATANSLANSEKSRAENNFKIAQSAVDKYLSQVSGDPTLASPSFLEIRSSLLKTALPFYEEFLKQNPGDNQLATDRGKALMRLGNIWKLSSENEKAIQHYEQAIELFTEVASRPTTDRSKSDMAMLDLQGCWLEIASAQSGTDQDANSISGSTNRNKKILRQLLSGSVKLKRP